MVRQLLASVMIRLVMTGLTVRLKPLFRDDTLRLCLVACPLLTMLTNSVRLMITQVFTVRSLRTVRVNRVGSAGEISGTMNEVVTRTDA